MYFPIDTFVFHMSLSLNAEKKPGRNSDQSKCRHRLYQSKQEQPRLPDSRRGVGGLKLLLVTQRERERGQSVLSAIISYEALLPLCRQKLSASPESRMNDNKLISLEKSLETFVLLLSRFSCVRLCAIQRQQPTRLPHPWDSPGKNTGVGCHFLMLLPLLLYCLPIITVSGFTKFSLSQEEINHISSTIFYDSYILHLETLSKKNQHEHKGTIKY